ncbi:MAG: D-2-hydroxyacid dehydrogenase [Cellvibrionaceae bacterium]|nr:D-2-hydroxyacid dehydrogenase [Cellvibrionaceae bacterium]
MTRISPFNPDGGVVFLDAATLGDVDLTHLSLVAAPLHLYPKTTARELAERHCDAWCVITNKVLLDRAFFLARPNLRLVCVTATGVNNVDLEAAREHGVTVANCKGYSTETVAQHTFMLMLAMLRSMPLYQRDVAAGTWSQSDMFCLLNHPVRELQGLKLGVVGYGDIGKRVAEIARLFGVEVLIADRRNGQPKAGRTPFREVLANCDILTLHCPLTADTTQLIDEKTLGLMRPSAFLINTSRGQLIDEPALLQALQQKTIAGAALDVLTTEPPAADHPLLKANLPNLIITPHCAWASREARQTALEQTVGNIEEYLKANRD